jgi:hypothetical protein
VRVDIDGTLGPFSDAYHEADKEHIQACDRLAKVSRNELPAKVQANRDAVVNIRARWHKVCVCI